MLYKRRFETDLGCVEIVSDEEAVLKINLAVKDKACDSPSGQPAREEAGTKVGKVGKEESPPVLVEAERQLRAYLAGDLRDFNLPLSYQGTPFQEAVWQALMDTPYGQTKSYEALARAVGRPRACRAVGSAAGKNPLLIIIPCHRLIRKDGKLGGFREGLSVKKKLLALEEKD